MSGGDRYFVDTNVLLYAFDPSHPAKQGAASKWLSQLWEEGSGSISWQVLHEFYVNAVSKAKVDALVARKAVETLTLWRPVDSSAGLIRRAWFWVDEAQLSYWDALILSAAERSGSAWLLSEDFQEGRSYAGVRILNPFSRSSEHNDRT